MATNPLGTGLLGTIRPGDELAAGLLARKNALGITYTISVSKYAVALPLTYTIQAANVGILQLYYLISPPEGFAINGDTTIISPDQVQYIPRVVTGRDLLGAPLYGGYPVMAWTYTLLQSAEAQHLLSFYNPVSPAVILVYPNEDGYWVQRRATMLPPNYGNLETVSVEGLVLTFLLLPN